MAYDFSRIPNLSNSCLFICIGQGGGNLGIEFNNLGYTTFFINTSKRDLDTLEAIDSESKLLIPGSIGCNKNRNKAKLYAKKYHMRIAKEIVDKFDSFSHIFVVFSSGGGSGSGISPLIMRSLSVIAPNKSISSICIVPSLDESQKAKQNSVDCYNDLTNLSLSNMYWVDNTSFSTTEEMFEFNKLVAERIHSIMNMSSLNSRANLDDEEVKQLLSVSGTVNVGDIASKQKINGYRLELDDNFVNVEGNASYIGLSLLSDDDLISEEISEKYGEQEDILKGYKKEGNSFCVMFGLPMPKSHFELLQESCLEYEENKNNRLKENVDNKIDVKRNNTHIEEEKNNKINSTDLERLFDDLL